MNPTFKFEVTAKKQPQPQSSGSVIRLRNWQPEAYKLADERFVIFNAAERCQVFCVNGLRFFLFESFFAPVKQPVAGAVGMWESRVFCEISKELWKA
jgi:hypothetical protein